MLQKSYIEVKDRNIKYRNKINELQEIHFWRLRQRVSNDY